MRRSRTFFVAAASSLALGCSISLIDAPKFAPPKPAAETFHSAEAPSCPKTPKLPPEMPAIPDRVRIIIDGDQWELDEGGELMLRAYVDTREALKR